MNLPIAFQQRMQNQLNDFNGFENVILSQNPPVSIRYNKNKNKKHLKIERPVLWCEDAYYLTERPLFTLDPLFHAGTFYVQEASSMFLREVLIQFIETESLTVLDLCAAPGGKTTLMLDYFNNNSLIVANEVIKSRYKILRENIIKWGNTNMITTSADAKDLGALNGFFDLVVVDAPCSGEGLFRKDAGAMNHWSEDNVKLCAARQKRILKDIIPSIKNNGFLIYSTCTYNSLENDENIKWLSNEMGFEVLQIDTSRFNGIQKTPYGCQFYPHLIKGEGFFISILQKKDSSITKNISSKKKTKRKNAENELSILNKKEKEKIQDFILNNELTYFYDNDKINAINSHFKERVTILKNKIKWIEIGLSLGEIKKNALVPNHEWAMSLDVNQDLPFVELDEKQALLYLKRENIYLEQASKGWNLVRYKGQNLGWVKHLGNRTNNYYPKEWRIRMNIPT